MKHRISHPPRAATWLARMCIHDVDADAVLGDLEETYRQYAIRLGHGAAVRWYWSQVLRSLPRLLLRSIYWSHVMLLNYVRVALRNLRKQKTYAFINVFGMAIGIAVCTLIFLFIRDELTYDRFHADSERIFQAQYQRFFPDGSFRGANPNLPIPAGPTMLAEIPEIDDFVRLGPDRLVVRISDDSFQQPVLFADPSLFDMFSFELIHGNAATALSDIRSIVLTEKTAKKYFGNDDPMGRVIAVRVESDYEDYTVTGVAKTVPGNSTIQFEAVLPFARLIATDNYRDREDSWDLIAFQTYVTLASPEQSASVGTKLAELYDRHYPKDAEAETGAQETQTFAIQPLHEIHLTTVSAPRYSYILSGIAIAILFIACINFMTLAIGRSASRSKEVGIRKVVGAQRRQVAGQFWSEAILMSVLSLLLGLALAHLFLPVFNDLAGKSLQFDYASNWTTIAMLSALVMFTGLAAGSYPALVLSSFKPVEVLKNRHKLNGSNKFTKSLVVVQFAVSVFLIIGTVIMQKQMQYVQTQDLGYNKEHVLVVRNSGLDGRITSQRLRDRLAQHSSVLGVTATGNKLGYSGSSGVRFDHNGVKRNVDLISVEANFIAMMNIELTRGRNFDAARPTDSTDSAIVNEALLRDFDITDPIGKPVPGFPLEQAPIIIGVTNDFNYQALYQEVGPLMLSMQDFWGFRYTMIRLSPDNIQESVDLVEKAWDTIAPELPFSYFFLDEDMLLSYRADQRWADIINYASIFAVLIACLGLFGLVSLSVASRAKEVGIRKVLGARTHGITLHLSKEFLLLVFAGIALATPIGYIVMNRWLDSFAFRIHAGVGAFFLASSLAIGIALLAVGLQSFKAALANPVDSLRYE